MTRPPSAARLAPHILAQLLWARARKHARLLPAPLSRGRIREQRTVQHRTNAGVKADASPARLFASSAPVRSVQQLPIISTEHPWPSVPRVTKRANIKTSNPRPFIPSV